MNRRQSLIYTIFSLFGIQPITAAPIKSTKFCLNELDFQALKKAVLDKNTSNSYLKGQRDIVIEHTSANNILFALAQGIKLQDKIK